MDEVSADQWLMVNFIGLKVLGQHLVDIHGQHDQEELMRPSLHIALDELGMQPLSKPKMLIVKPLKITNVRANKWWNSTQPAGKQGPY